MAIPKLAPLALALASVTVPASTPAQARPARCPNGTLSAILFRNQLKPLPQPRRAADYWDQYAELRREPDRVAAAGYIFISWAAYPHAARYVWRRFAIDSLGQTFRLAGFDTLDLEALACRLAVDSLESTTDAWRAVYQFAQALGPFEDGATTLPGVSAPGVPTNPRWTERTWDATRFPRPEMRWLDSASLYEGRATIDWSASDGRTKIVEWRFRVERNGRFARLHERLLGGRPDRKLDWPGL